jgi:tetratricopeptide (TPR) repeat protein
MENLFILAKAKKWKELTSSYSLDEIVHFLPFQKTLILSYKLLFNESWDESLQAFAVNLLESIRSKHPKEWDASWEYDAFLGLAYYIILNYDERYNAFKRASDKIQIPPPQLLIALASCCVCPGTPPIPYDEAIKYLKEAIKDYLYVDAVELLRKMYWYKDDVENEHYWASILKQIKGKNVESPSLEPEFLRNCEIK